MDWARDDFGLNNADLENVFRYEQKQTTVIKLVESNEYRARIWSLGTYDEWSDWIENEVLSIHNNERGLFLVLCKRKGETNVLNASGLSIDEWLSEVKMQKQQTKINHSYTLDSLEEKQAKSLVDTKAKGNSGRRDLRTLPFDFDTFKLVTQSFRTHGSISRVISRADVPFFSCESALMTERAYVYNARSSNVWEADLALSATHFPASCLTYAIMYGCSFDTEANIISRLQRVKLEASHPLLLPGIFAELELVRQTKLVERTINEVEAKIGELDLPACEKGRTQQETDQHNQDKRDAWLDLTYLRNAIISWNTQLQKMIHHSSKLNDEEHEVSQIIRVNTVRQDNCSREKPERMDSPLESARFAGQLVEKSDQTWHRPYAESKEEYTENPREKFRVPKDHGKKIFHTSQLSEVGNKIRSRLMAIKDENDEKIRDCSMRVDGMAMATQWSHGETNVEIAMATNRDSRVMRSIALVTMVFLPGTFFATVFSMTFFDWFGQDGTARVSNYLWIYILITISFTFLTVGSWYFFVFYRQRYSVLKEDGNIA